MFLHETNGGGGILRLRCILVVHNYVGRIVTTRMVFISVVLFEATQHNLKCHTGESVLGHFSGSGLLWDESNCLMTTVYVTKMRGINDTLKTSR